MMHQYYQQYNDVVFLDATYKTNKYDMHLVLFSGVSSDNKNVILAFGLLKRETAEAYQWMLNKL